MLIIEHYVEDGRVPFLEWMSTLEPSELTRVTDYLLRLSMGNTSHLKSLSGGLVEVRIRGSKEMRLYFGRIEHNRLLALWGGAKKHQTKDILKARTYWSRFITARSHGTV